MNTTIDFLSKELNKLFAEQRESFSKFFYQIALFSAGSMVLSVTFLGFLSSSKVTFEYYVILV